MNPEAKVYYAPGAQAYGNTVPGFYLSQAEARNAEYRSTNTWGIGYGTSERPIRTKTNLNQLSKSGLSWTEGNVTLNLDNKSDWEITEVTISISLEGGPEKTYRLFGHSLPKSKDLFQASIGDSPNGRKWTWDFLKVKGFPP